MKTNFYLFLWLGFLTSCTINNKNSKTDDVFIKIESSTSGLNFSNDITSSESFNIFSYRNFYNGGGVALGDVNGDGLIDVFLTANMGENKLYMNKGNFKFEDITVKSGVGGTKGWSTGTVMVDINADGLLDIYVCNAGYLNGDDRKNELFINNGNIKDDQVPTFTESAAAYNLDEAGFTTHAAFFDYDLDGDLDCYILNNSFISPNTLNYSNKRELYAKDWLVKDFLKGGGDKLLRNEGGIFKDVTKESGIYGSLIGFGLGITVGDVNGDHWPDMYISNDFFEHDYLYINQQDGTFKEEIEDWVGHMSLASMGADMADINNDGYPEIFVTEMLPSDDRRLKEITHFESYNLSQFKKNKGFLNQYMQNTLQLNNRDNSFSEIANFSGVAASDWSWGALLFDADNDGYRDIYISNGIYRDLTDQDFINFFANDVIQKMVLTGKKQEKEGIIKKMPSNPIANRLFKNSGNFTFIDKTNDWGVDFPSFSNGAAYGDLDNDGDLDLVVNNLNSEAFLFKNQTTEKMKAHYLKIKLEGEGKNTYAIGSKIKVYRDGEILNSEIMPTRGYQSSVDYSVIFGLGTNEKIDSLEVQWPDMKKSILKNLPIDTTLVLNIRNASKSIFEQVININEDKSKILSRVNSDFSAHKENSFVDFDEESLSYRKVSREGPCVAVVDINGDGLDDIFIGGASNQAAQLYFQTTSGDFELSKSDIWESHAVYEDTAVLLFDVDGDNDLDIFVGSGGNNYPKGHRFLRDRLYINEGGNGQNFHYDKDYIPAFGLNTSCAVAFDLENDGDLDLYVGSRSIPGGYGYPTRSFIYRNDGNHFTEVGELVAPDLHYGMVTDAKMADMTGDGIDDLVIVGEWMSPKIYEIHNGHLKSWKTNLSQFSGWWYALETADIDADGDQDLILGNRGENFYLSGSSDAPLKLWVKDFDNNNTIDKILTRTIDGKDKPVLMLGDLTSQIPSLKKKNLKHSEYALKSIQELFSEDELKNVLTWHANYFKSCVAINNGNGEFKLEPFPDRVQLSSVNAILCKDLNNDGLKDVVLGGNDSGFLPQFSELDASYGHVLLNNKGSFKLVDNKTSGFFVKGEIRSLKELKINQLDNILVGINNSKPELFKIHK